MSTQTDHLSAGEEIASKAFRRGVSLPIRERYGVTVPVAASFIGISKSRIYELLADGTLDGKIIRGRRIVLVESVLRMVGEAPSTGNKAA